MYITPSRSGKPEVKLALISGPTSGRGRRGLGDPIERPTRSSDVGDEADYSIARFEGIGKRAVYKVQSEVCLLLFLFLVSYTHSFFAVWSWVDHRPVEYASTWLPRRTRPPGLPPPHSWFSSRYQRNHLPRRRDAQICPRRAPHSRPHPWQSTTGSSSRGRVYKRVQWLSILPRRLELEEREYDIHG